ncbi:MAG: hypothetical protein ACYC2U_05445 [Candidatus Amoebophilus sp.]
MFKPASIFLVISGLLITSCHTKLTPANNKDIAEPFASKRERIEVKDRDQEDGYKRSRTDSDWLVSIAEDTAESRTRKGFVMLV